MGYDLHITRREVWHDEGNDITQQEWVALVQTDPELNFDDENHPTMTRWGGTSEYDDPWLCWLHGQIETKNPDVALIEKMIQIAEKLGAHVQGDDGEIYPGPETNRYWQTSSPFQAQNQERQNAGGLFGKMIQWLFKNR